jgi:hypothetical protein
LSSILISAFIHSRQGLCDSLEEKLDVMSDLSARLDEHQVVLLGLFLSLCLGYLPLVCQICLVPDQNDDDVVSSLASYIVDPFAGLLKCLGVCKWSVLAGRVWS